MGIKIMQTGRSLSIYSPTKSVVSTWKKHHFSPIPPTTPRRSQDHVSWTNVENSSPTFSRLIYSLHRFKLLKCNKMYHCNAQTLRWLFSIQLTIWSKSLLDLPDLLASPSLTLSLSAFPAPGVEGFGGRGHALIFHKHANGAPQRALIFAVPYAGNNPLKSTLLNGLLSSQVST